MKKKLLLLCVAILSTFGAWAQTSPWTGVTLEQARNLDGVWLYNVETGTWLQNNDRKRQDLGGDWSTRAEVDTRGIDFKLDADATDPEAVIINPKFSNNGSLNSTITSALFYMDTGQAKSKWYFEATSNGVSNGYRIGDENFKYLCVGADGYLTVSDLAALSNGTWQIVTREERLKAMANASEANPIDATWLIQGPTLANNDNRNNAWSRKVDGGTNVNGPVSAMGGDGVVHCHRVQEFWSTNMANMTQMISKIPNGTYKFSVQGYYRDGSAGTKDQVVYFVTDRRAAGLEELRAKYFANGSEGTLMSILDDSRSASETGWDFQIQTSPYFVPNNTDQASYAIWKGGYQNPSINVTVADSTMTFGIDKTTGINDDWIIVSNFKLTYLGPAVDISAVKTALDKAIASAETVTATSTDVLNSNFATALSTAKGLLHSTDAAAMAAATTALTAAQTAVLNTTSVAARLVSTLALTDFTGPAVDAAKDAKANATTVDQLNTALNALQVARKIAKSSSQASVYAGNAPADGATYYFYNVGAKRFFCGGNDWGTHASVGFPGIPLTLVANGAGFVIDTHLANGATEHYLNFGGYVDSGAQDVWSFIDQGNGVYRIGRDGSTAGGTAGTNVYLGIRDGQYSQVDTDLPETNGDFNNWVLVTKADRDALLANASAANPVDATYLIGIPGFNQREDASVWTNTPGSDGSGVGIWGRGNNNPDFAFESWNNNNEFELTQTLYDLKPGYYQVSVQGFYRDADTPVFVQEITDGQTPAQAAKLFAVTDAQVEALMPAVNAEANHAPGFGSQFSIGEIPDNVPQACNYFQNGLYKTTLTVNVGSDGTLLIGVHKDATTVERAWLVIDNFRLTYFGQDQPSGITGVETTTQQGSDKIYNLSGQRVDNTYKGIVIKNGKKIVVK